MVSGLLPYGAHTNATPDGRNVQYAAEHHSTSTGKFAAMAVINQERLAQLLDKAVGGASMQQKGRRDAKGARIRERSTAGGQDHLGDVQGHRSCVGRDENYRREAGAH